MLLLGIETSSQAAGAALVSDGSVICEYMLNQKKTHSERLLPMTEQMLAATGCTLSDVDVFACGIGPGSFTGVRIGAATVKGFAQALDKPIVTLDSLETLAFGCFPFTGLAVSVIFAREDEVFCAAYSGFCGGEPQIFLPPAVRTVDALLSSLRGQDCLFVGDGAQRHRERILRAAGGARFAGARQNIISAANLALLGELKARGGSLSRYDEIAPLYLRVSQAEREYPKKQGGKEQ